MRPLELVVIVGLLCALASAQVQIPLLSENSTSSQEELLRATEFESIFDLVRTHMNVDNPNPAAVTRVQRLLAQMKAQVAREQRTDDIEYRRRFTVHQATQHSLGLTLNNSQGSVHDADIRIARASKLEKQGYIFLGIIGSRVEAVQGYIASQNRSIIELDATRSRQAERLILRVKDASDSLVGINNVIDTLGSMQSLNFNSTLKNVLNDHHAPTIALLELAAKAKYAGDDTLDEFRAMLFKMNELMHAYIKDIQATEAAQIIRYDAIRLNMTNRMTRLTTRLTRLNSTISPMIAYIDNWKNETAMAKDLRGEMLLKAGESRAEISRENREWSLFEQQYKDRKNGRAVSVKTIASIENIIHDRTKGSFTITPQATAGPTLPYQFVPTS